MNRFLTPVLAAALIAGCAKPPLPVVSEEHDHGHEEAGHVELSADAQRLAGIELYPVRFQQVQDALQVTGTVSSTSGGRAVLTPPAPGRVTSISVQLGDKVLQGQTLATLESPELAQAWSNVAEAMKTRDAAKADLDQLRAEVGLSTAKLMAARSSLARQRDLVKAGAFSQAPVQQARTDLMEAQSELLSVQKEEASHAEQLRRLENLYREGIVSRSEIEASRLEIQQDQIRKDRALARIEGAKATYRREENIATRGLLNARELQTADAEVRTAELELQRSRIRVKSAESSLETATRAIANAESVYRSSRGSGGGSVGATGLVAPISGTITRLDVTRGQAVDRTQVLLEIENLESVWVTANVPEADSAKVRKGASVRVTADSVPGQVFDAVVQVVGSRVDPKTRTVPAQCLVSRAAGRLKPAMFATVSLATGASKRSLVVRTTSIVTEGEGSFVFVKEGEGFERREVTLGTRSGENVCVVSGIKVGEQVVAKGTFILGSEQTKDELKGHEH